MLSITDMPAGIFNDLAGADCPIIPKSWTGMNARINLQSTRFLEDRPSKHLYPCPPPSMFVNTAKASDYFAQYRHLREILIFRIASSAPMLGTQQWRSILGLRTSEKSSNTQSSVSRSAFEDAKKLLGRCFESQGIEFKQSLIAPSELDQTDIRQRRVILCELSELGFRYDMQYIDNRLYKKSVAPGTDEALGQDLDHSDKLLSIFPERSLTTVDPSGAPRGLYHSFWDIRSLYLERWRDLMSEWEVPLPAAVLGHIPLRDDEHWERILIGHYLQIAYDLLGRPPFVPYMIA